MWTPVKVTWVKSGHQRAKLNLPSLLSLQTEYLHKHKRSPFSEDGGLIAKFVDVIKKGVCAWKSLCTSIVRKFLQFCGALYI